MFRRYGERRSSLMRCSDAVWVSCDGDGGRVLGRLADAEDRGHDPRPLPQVH